MLIVNIIYYYPSSLYSPFKGNVRGSY